jgi:neprosin-like protein
MLFSPRTGNRERYMVSLAAKNGAGGPSPTASEPPKNEDGHVSKSRRGLLAAGLAVAVAGSLGILSTLNADADQIPDAPASSTTASTDAAGAPADVDASTTEADEVPTPPTKLPWGTRPERIKRGAPGASSRSLAAAGADAAAPSADDTSVVADPEFSPKGRTSDTAGTLTTEKTTVVPPAPPAAGKLAAEPVAGQKSVHFLYADASQFVDSSGTYANLVIGKPKLAKEDYHSLAEIAVQSGDGKQIVEVGWNVDRTVNGDDDPHLFVYHWVDKKESCYNACGFVNYSKTIGPGWTVPSGVSRQFGIQFFNDAWWIAYDSEWIGYFPAELWDGKFTRSGLIQWFGEVAASSTKPCTQMGTGIAASEPGAARFGSVTLLEALAPSIEVTQNYDFYGALRLSDRTFRFGGPGACA